MINHTNTIRFEHDDFDAITAGLVACHRGELARFLPPGGDRLPPPVADFWADVLERLHRGEWQDAVTKIERWAEPRRVKKSDLEAVTRARMRVAA